MRSASASKTWATTPTRASEWNGTSTCGRVTRLIEVDPHTGQPTATPTVPAAGVSSRKDDGVTVAEEAPGPFPTVDPGGGERGELGRDVVPARGHQVEEGGVVVEPEWPPVERVVTDQRHVLAPAPALELDAVHGRVRSASEPLDLPERGKPDRDGPVRRAREQECSGEGVDSDHDHGVLEPSDGVEP